MPHVPKPKVWEAVEQMQRQKQVRRHSIAMRFDVHRECRRRRRGDAILPSPSVVTSGIER
jgi:hypothetical protein